MKPPRQLPMLDRTRAQAFLRANFDMDVPDDDPLVALYMMMEMSLDHLRPQIEAAALAASTDATGKAVEGIVDAREVLADTARRLGALREPMIATHEAAERTRVLNETIDRNIAVLDERIKAMEAGHAERMADIDGRIDTLADVADRVEKAVVALTAGSKGRKGLFG